MSQEIGSWDVVYRLVKKIPRGRVTTYGELARALRLKGGARAAGHAMAACPTGRGIPWQRVVGSGGRLLIREPYAALQRKLLESEGVRIEGRAVDMKRYGWSPVKPSVKSKTRGAGSREAKKAKPR
jgi:methylated-DNA-protein-cysteine methyltransferase-like protein